METSLVLDNTTKHLGLRFKKRFEHDSSDVCLKVKGLVNTVTADANIEGKIYKFVRLGELTPYTPGTVYRPDTRLRLGIGARQTTNNDILFSIAAKKKMSVMKNLDFVRGREVINSYTQLIAKAHYDYNMRVDSWGGEAMVAAQHAIFRFSEDQDVRITAGLKGKVSPKGMDAVEPFLRVEENCWGLQTNLKGQWRITYDL